MNWIDANPLLYLALFSLIFFLFYAIKARRAATLGTLALLGVTALIALSYRADIPRSAALLPDPEARARCFTKALISGSLLSKRLPEECRYSSRDLR